MYLSGTSLLWPTLATLMLAEAHVVRGAMHFLKAKLAKTKKPDLLGVVQRTRGLLPLQMALGARAARRDRGSGMIDLKTQL